MVIRPETILVNVLREPFDPNTLASGIYVVTSGSPAYPLARAMIAVGAAKLVGQNWGEDLKTALTIHVPQSRRRPSRPVTGNPKGLIEMPTDASYFVSVKREYKDWKLAWWREVVQNATDAGAEHVSCEVKQDADGKWLVACDDDGSGMDEETLLKVFLVFFGSKHAGRSEGGFGKAKELILLPWLSWSVHTRDTKAVGSGLLYDWNKAPMRKGTRVEVLMPDDMHTDEYQARKYIGRCWLPKTEFRVNGEVVEAKLRNGRTVRELPGKAVMYYTKTGFDIATLYVRTEMGQFMFDKTLSYSAKGLVVIELQGEKAAQRMLMVSRDEFRDTDEKGNYAEGREVRLAVEAFQNEIAQEAEEALKPKKNLFRKKYTGTGKFAPTPGEDEARMVQAIDNAMTTMEGKKERAELNKESIELAGKLLEELSGTRQGEAEVSLRSNAEAAEAILGESFSGPEHIHTAAKQIVWRPDFFIVNEDESFHVPRKFKPESMIPSVLRLIKTWAEVCRYVLIKLNCAREYGVGFLFPDLEHDESKALACYIQEGDENWIMINPLRKDGSIYNPADDVDLKAIFAYAIHEATHMVDQVFSHDRAFAAAASRNVAVCIDGWRAVKKISKSIKLRGQEEFIEEREARVRAAQTRAGKKFDLSPILSSDLYKNQLALGKARNGETALVLSDGQAVITHRYSRAMACQALSEAGLRDEIVAAVMPASYFANVAIHNGAADQKTHVMAATLVERHVHATTERGLDRLYVHQLAGKDCDIGERLLELKRNHATRIGWEWVGGERPPPPPPEKKVEVETYAAKYAQLVPSEWGGLVADDTLKAKVPLNWSGALFMDQSIFIWPSHKAGLRFAAEHMPREWPSIVVDGWVKNTDSRIEIVDVLPSAPAKEKVVGSVEVVLALLEPHPAGENARLAYGWATRGILQELTSPYWVFMGTVKEWEETKNL